jgi:thioester reductase-like protein
VFLTGATGFVGAAILWNILDRSPARVFCHLRAPGIQVGHDRLMRGLSALGAVPPSWRARVIPVVGDLTRPRLGITDSQWAEVAAETGEIFHVGALVNHVAPYSLFRLANVHATREILRLSATSAQKQIHHVSSLGYWSGYCGEPHDAARNITGPGTEAAGYLLSKWVSDRLMEQASDRGFPVAIYRLGYVSGGWQGASNQRGWLELHLRAFARLRQMPEGDACLAVTPVDLIAPDIWALSRRPDASGHAYNLAYREQVITMPDTEQAFADIGLPVEHVSTATWLASFRAAPHDAYMQLLDVFLHEPTPQWNAERHAFFQRVSAATGALLGNPPPFPKTLYLKAMLAGFVRSDQKLRADGLAA